MVRQNKTDDGSDLPFAVDQLGVARAILDRQALRILSAISSKPMTAARLSRSCDIPIAGCRRWLRRLESLGILASEDGTTTGNGEPSRLYRSQLRSLRVRLGEGRIRTRIDVTSGPVRLVSEGDTMLETRGLTRSRSHLRTIRRRPGFHPMAPRRTERETGGTSPISLPPYLRASTETMGIGARPSAGGRRGHRQRGQRIARIVPSASDRAVVEAAQRRLLDNRDDDDALFALAAWSAIAGDPGRAMALLDQLVARRPDYPGVWWLKARVFDESGQGLEAEACKKLARSHAAGDGGVAQAEQ